MKIKLIFLILLVVLSFKCLSQNEKTTFQKFKNVSTSVVTAYSEGLKDGDFLDNWTLRPYFIGNQYFFKYEPESTVRTSIEIDEGVGAGRYEHCFFNSSDKCYIYMYIRINGEEILELTGSGNYNNTRDVKEFKFNLSKDVMTSIVNATSLNFKIQTYKSEDYSTFQYTPSLYELNCLKDFGVGMELIKK